MESIEKDMEQWVDELRQRNKIHLMKKVAAAKNGEVEMSIKKNTQ